MSPEELEPYLCSGLEVDNESTGETLNITYKRYWKGIRKVL
jgi:hypothetical protein